MRVLIIGAGGHGQVVADVLQRMHDAGEDVTPIGFLDDSPQLAGRSILGLQVLGSTVESDNIAHDALIVAIGDNSMRRQMFLQLKAQGERFAIACHPTAVVAPDVVIGEGSMICANVVVNPGSVVGSNAILNTACIVDHHNQIGDHAHIAPGVQMGGEVTVGVGSLVGIGATVMPRQNVGDWCVIGAGAVVNRDVQNGVTAVGVPARVKQKTKPHG